MPFRTVPMLLGTLVLLAGFCAEGTPAGPARPAESLGAEAICVDGSLDLQGTRGRTASAIRWVASLESGLKSARRSRRVVMVLLVQPGTAASDALESGAIASAAVVKASRAWVCVRVDGGRAPGQAQSLRVAAYPTVLFLEGDGRELGRMVGARTAAQLLEGAARIVKRRG